MATKTILVDGLNVEVTDDAERAILKLQGQLADSSTKLTAAETKVGELTATVATRDGEIVALNAKVKDAEVGPEKLQQLVADRAQLIAKAKAVDPNVVTDGKSDSDIRKAIVSAKLGDAAPTDDNGIAGAFAALTADAKVDPVARVIASQPSVVTDNGAVVQSIRGARYQ